MPMSKPITHREAVKCVKDWCLNAQLAKGMIDWIDDAHDAIEGAIAFLNQRHHRMIGGFCSLPGCGDCGLRRDLERLIGGEPVAWPNCRNCNGCMDEMSKYAGKNICSEC